MEISTSGRTQGLKFIETMKGFFVYDPSADFKQLESHNPRPADALDFEFTVTIESENLKQMLENREHQARISGSVTAPCLSPERMTVSDGIFNLFIEYPEEVETRHMRYRFCMAGMQGRVFFLDGIKVIRNEELLRVWHDTTTLYITVYEGSNGTGSAIGRGILNIEPKDFLKQMTTMRVTNALKPGDELRCLAEFGSFFAGTLYQHYGGVFVGPSAFNPTAPPRLKRPLRANAPEMHPFVTPDGVLLQLTRYRGGSKGPVILSPGLGVSSLIFSTDTIDTNLLEFLFSNGYDVWLLDFRASIMLEASKRPSDGDQVARFDYPSAVAKVREVTGAESVQFVVHCWGATTFFMSMLAGLQGVRSFVSSQIGLFSFSPWDVNLKTGLHVPEVFDNMGIKALNATATADEPWWKKLYDRALEFPAMVVAQGRCNDATCHRITFMYASLYNHTQLNKLAHENLHEMFGVGNMRSFEHIASIGRAGKLVDFSGNDTYLPQLERLNLPIAFIHGEQNHCFLPEGTLKTYELLCSKFGPGQYSRHVIPNYGHIDCIFGKNAAADVYPLIVQHLDKAN